MIYRLNGHARKQGLPLFLSVILSLELGWARVVGGISGSVTGSSRSVLGNVTDTNAALTLNASLQVDEATPPVTAPHKTPLFLIARQHGIAKLTRIRFQTVCLRG